VQSRREELRMIIGISHLLFAWAVVAAGVGVLTRLR
jgi:hypothetical protein